jgi:hypothetical protein
VWAEEGGLPEMPRVGVLGDFKNPNRVPARPQPNDLLCVILQPAFKPAGPGVAAGREDRTSRFIGFYAVILNLDEMLRDIDRFSGHGVKARVTLTDTSPDPEGHYPRIWREYHREAPTIPASNPSARFLGRDHYSYNEQRVGDRTWVLEIGDLRSR